ncbi:ash2 Set1 complex component ash2 [Candida maltosa Xu316]
MNKETSEEPSIEPQVQGNESIESEDSYTTRLKSRQRADELGNKSKLKQKEHNVVIHPRLKPVPFRNSDLMVHSDTYPLNEPVITIKDVQFYQVEDLPLNKRGFKYKDCRPNPEFVSNLYSTTDDHPYTVRTSIFDRSPAILFNDDLSAITTTQGWRSARANVCIREGSYYFEFVVLNSEDSSHVRIGIGRKEASLEAPVGFDGYSYGLRDVDGQFMTISRRQKLCIENGFKTGDVIGVFIELPSLEEHRKAVDSFINEKNELYKHEHKLKKRRKRKVEVDIKDNEKFNAFNNIVRDQIPIKYKNSLYYEQYEYTTTKTMEHLLNPVTVFGEKAVIEQDDKTENIPVIPNSKIRFFKNGVEQESISNLYSFLPTNIEDNEDINLGPNTKQQQNPNYRNTDDGTLGYYPMLSAFEYGVVKLNPGPEFAFPPQEPVKPLSDRYDDQVVEQYYWDILDEVEAQYLDSFDL